MKLKNSKEQNRIRNELRIFIFHIFLGIFGLIISVIGIMIGFTPWATILLGAMLIYFIYLGISIVKK